MRSFLILLALILVIAASCKKNSATVPSPVIIYNAGTKMVGAPIKFSSNVGPGNSFTWDFGDSTTSGEATPTHTYTSEGFRTVRLTIDNNSAKTAAIYIGVFNDPIYTNMVGGSRSWKHFYILDHSGYPRDTTQYADTVFEVKMIDVFTVAIGNDTLSYYPVSDSVLGFQRYLPSNSSDDLQFNHNANELHFVRFRHISAGASSQEHYYSL